MMRDAVVIVLTDDDGRLLMIRRGPDAPRAGWWMPPGGRVETGESAADAVRREAREEVGLEVEPTACLGSCPSDDGKFRLLFWRARIIAGTLAPDAREVAEARWVDRAAYEALTPAFAEHRALLADCFASRGGG
jgi:ADP-ribose pyrophosphatase YjhB (NUDIX family)